MRLLCYNLRVPVLMVVLAGILLHPRVDAAPAAASGKESPFGINSHLGNRVRSDEQATMVGLMREAGMQWGREEISWDKLQSERGGPYRWGGNEAGLYNYDQAIALQRDAGINVLGLLAYNPAWFKGKNPVLDEWIGDWGNYVYEVVARYGRDRKQIRYWEVWNEANLRPFGYEHGLYTVNEYVRILQVARAAIKAADPEAVIVLGGLYDIWGPLPTTEDYDSFDYLRMLHAAGGWNTFDILGLHPYRPAAPETVLNRRGPRMNMQDEFRALDALLAEFGPKPVWLTEVGWSSANWVFGVSDADQAVYLQRMYVLALAHPSIQKVFWYDLRNDAGDSAYDQPAQNLNESEFHYGLLRRRFPLDANAPDLRKPAFLAYRAMTDALAGMRLEGAPADGVRQDMPGIFWYRFGNGERHVDILWRSYGEPRDMEVPCDCREARVRQWNGSLLKVTAAIDNNRVVGRLEELGTPVMIETGPDKSREGKVFLETGHYLKGPFARYWEQQGGLGQYGLPITGEMIEPDPQTGRARVVQYFERNRFDYFPEFANTAYEVQIGRLGDVALQRKGIDWQTLPKRTAADEGCLFFAQSGHQLCPPFRDRWEKAGGLARNGLPLTEAYTDTDRLIQFFERSRFEAHPENQPPWDIQLGLLSRELYGSWGRWR